MSLSSFLPAPTAPAWDRDEERAKERASKPVTALVSAQKNCSTLWSKEGLDP